MVRRENKHEKRDEKMMIALRLRISRDRLRVLRKLGEERAYLLETVEYAALIGKWEKTL